MAVLTRTVIVKSIWLVDELANTTRHPCWIGAKANGLMTTDCAGMEAVMVTGRLVSANRLEVWVKEEDSQDSLPGQAEI